MIYTSARSDQKTAQEVLSQSGTNFSLCTIQSMLEKIHTLRLRHICDDQDSKNAIFWHGNFGLRNILFWTHLNGRRIFSNQKRFFFDGPESRAQFRACKRVPQPISSEQERGKMNYSLGEIFIWVNHFCFKIIVKLRPTNCLRGLRISKKISLNNLGFLIRLLTAYSSSHSSH